MAPIECCITDPSGECPPEYPETGPKEPPEDPPDAAARPKPAAAAVIGIEENPPIGDIDMEGELAACEEYMEADIPNCEDKDDIPDIPAP